MATKFKTTRLMRRGAAIIKDWFLISRANHKRSFDWGRTTSASIGRWLRVMEARKREYERLHPQPIPHLRHELLRWLEEAGEGGIARLLSEWEHLRGPSDAERAAKSAEKALKRLEKKHPLFAAVGALEEVAVIPTQESVLARMRLWEKDRGARASAPSSAELAKWKVDPDKMQDDRMSLNQLRVWGRVSLGWPIETKRALSDDDFRDELAKRDVDRPHIVLAREVLLANARNKNHAQEVLGGIFYSVHAYGIEGGIIGAPALRALRVVSREVFGTDEWLEDFVLRGKRRRLERQAEKKAERATRLARWAPKVEQLVIPLEVVS